MIRFAGRKGVFQFLYGIAYLAIGYALTLPATSPIRFIHEMIPAWARLIIWCLPALIAIATAFISSSRASIIGYTVLSLPLAWRVTSYVISSIVYDIDVRAVISGCIVYGMMLFALMIVASWPEPNPDIINKVLKEDATPKRWWRRHELG